MCSLCRVGPQQSRRDDRLDNASMTSSCGVMRGSGSFAPIPISRLTTPRARLPPDWKMAELPVHAYFPMGRTTRMAGRAFVDFIAAELKKEPFDAVAGPWSRRSPLAPGTRSGGTCSFGQEPDAFVGFIDPVFQQARRGDIAVLIAHVVKLVHMSDQRQIIVT